MSTDLAKTGGGGGGGGAMVEVTTGRVIQEVQAAMTIAKRFPRDPTAAIERIRQACKRTGLAEQAVYQYPRGGKKVEGPSIRLAEAMAQNWGNLDFGIIELEQRDGESDVMAYCWDLETNTRQTKVFTVKHERHKKDGEISSLTDPRDIYEMVANQGARRVRACILGVIPGDIQDKALAQCRETLAGDSKEPIADRVQRMVAAFAEFGVTIAMLERRLGYKLSACDEHGLVGLRGIFTSLRDGMSTREDWFDVETAEAVADHQQQARKAREKQRGEHSPGKAREVEATEGIDDPLPSDVPETDSEVEEARTAVKIRSATAILPVETFMQEAAELEIDDAGMGRLAKLANEQKEKIRAKRGKQP